MSWQVAEFICSHLQNPRYTVFRFTRSNANSGIHHQLTYLLVSKRAGSRLAGAIQQTLRGRDDARQSSPDSRLLLRR